MNIIKTALISFTVLSAITISNGASAEPYFEYNNAIQFDCNNGNIQQITFGKSVNPRDRLVCVNYEFDSPAGSLELSLDGTGLCIVSDRLYDANKIVSDGENGKSESGNIDISNGEHSLQFYIPDSSDTIVTFLDGRMVGNTLTNNSTGEFTGISAKIDGSLSKLKINKVSVTDMPDTITAAFVDDDSIQVWNYNGYPIVYLKDVTSRTVTMPQSNGVDCHTFKYWTDINNGTFYENNTTQISETTIFTAVYNDYTPPTLPGYVEVSGKYFYDDFYDTDATALTVTFSPLGNTYSEVTFTPNVSETKYSEQKVNSTTITTNGYVRYGIIVDEIVSSTDFSAVMSE